MGNGRRFLLFFLISKMNGFLYLCLLHFKKKMEQEDFNIREHQLTSRERDFENALRPLSFEDFSGQDKVVENLRIFVKAARLRGEALDHVLLHGPPGLGKTTLSNIIANELGATLAVCLPSFGVIYLISLFFDRFLQLTVVANAFKGIQACVIYLILSAGIKMLKNLQRTPFNTAVVAVVLAAMVGCSMLAVKFSSICCILLCGAAGVLAYAIGQGKKGGTK